MSSSVAEKLARKSTRKPNAKQVRLKLVYIDFWSAVKLAFLIGLCLAIIAIVGMFLIWTMLNQFQIFDKLDSVFKDISGTGGSSLKSIVGLGNVMGFSIIVAILDIVTTVLGAVFALLYNLSVKITGGLLVGFTNN